MLCEPHRRVLSYHDVLLLKSDIDLLQGPHWLNDQLIAFWFTHVAEDIHPGQSNLVALLPPGTSFLLLHSDPTESAIIFEPLQLHLKELVIFAVNDNPDVECAAGGSHWSCLAYHRMTNSFRHYDSSPGAGNTSVARELAGAAAPLVRSRHQPSGITLQQPTFVQVSSMPAQNNGHDCGLYVCAVAQSLCALLERWRVLPVTQPQQASTAGCGNCFEQCSSSNLGDCAAAASSSKGLCCTFKSQEHQALQAITGSSVSALRQHMLQVIQQLADQRPS